MQVVIGVLAGYLGSLGKAERWISGVAAVALVLALAPAAFANDPTTHQYASQLTQVCVGGETVTVETDGGGSPGAGAGTAGEACGETAAGGGGGIASGGGGGTAGAVGGTADSATVGSLPFTGLDLIILAAVAVALLAAGLLLRRGRAGAAEARG